jgi:hypothetical protein
MKLKWILIGVIIPVFLTPIYATTSTKSISEKKPHPINHKEKPSESLWYHPQTLCITTPDLRTMIEMTQNSGRALPNPCNPIWPMPMALSAGFNIDGKWGKLNSNIMGANVESVSLNDAYLSALAIANFWVRGFASIDIGNPTIHSNPSSHGRLGGAEYSAAYANNIAGNNETRLQLEQAFVTLGDITRFPIFIEAGKAFQDYGRYHIHPITRSLTQVMSESLAISGKLGWIINGFHGSLSILENRIGKFNHSSSNHANYGAALGFDQPECNGFRWNLGVGYLYNLIGVKDIAYNVVNFTKTDQYHKRVSGTALYADIYEGPFTLHGRYTVAIQRFSEFDLPRHGVSDFSDRNIKNTLLPHKQGAKPWSASFLATYHFVTFCDKNQVLYLGYEVSRQASALNLPRIRYVAGYNIDLWPATQIGIEWDRDLAYSMANGGTGRNSHLVSLRAAVSMN